ncbi:MAG: hypothetical protein ISS93_02575 [Candidatus Aenigmarchaeota archaeon]|nr:hypothetical protein [Candidatus Aenigmarchaeota archaeon]
MKQLRINLEELKEDKKRNFKDRLNFIDSWVDYIKTHSDKEWSEQQKILINKKQ